MICDLDAEAGEILSFWQEEVGETRWFRPPEGLDDRIRTRFEPAWSRAMATFAPGRRTRTAERALATLLLLDQFPRNMFRGTAQAFASDAQAMIVARRAVELGHDRAIPGSIRQFFYLPFTHSERGPDQDRGVWLMKARFGGDAQIAHARAHRAVIRRFGRFPSRNAALGRISTPSEAEFLATAGYARLVAEFSG